MTKKMYNIKDNNNRIANSIWIDKHNKPKQWCYTSFINPSIFMPLQIAEQEKQQLDILATQAGFDLQFKVVEVNPMDYFNTAGVHIGDCTVDTIPIHNFTNTWQAYAAIVPKRDRSERLWLMD